MTEKRDIVLPNNATEIGLNKQPTTATSSTSSIDQPSPRPEKVRMETVLASEQDADSLCGTGSEDETDTRRMVGTKLSSIVPIARSVKRSAVDTYSQNLHWEMWMNSTIERGLPISIHKIWDEIEDGQQIEVDKKATSYESDTKNIRKIYDLTAPWS